MKSVALMIAGLQAMVMAATSRERRLSEFCDHLQGEELSNCHLYGRMFCSNPVWTQTEFEDCMEGSGLDHTQRRATGTVDDWANLMQENCKGRAYKEQCMTQAADCFKEGGPEAIRVCMSSLSQPTPVPSLRRRDNVCNRYDDVGLCEYYAEACKRSLQRKGHSVKSHDDEELRKCIQQTFPKAAVNFARAVEAPGPQSTGSTTP